MSRRWARATRQLFCGRCRGEIAKGDPVLFIALPGLKDDRPRCPECEGPAPPDLPALIEKSFPAPQSFETLASAKSATRGGLKKLAREWMPFREPREPGDEG